MTTCQYCGADIEPYTYGETVDDGRGGYRLYLKTVDYEAAHLEHAGQCPNHPMHVHANRRTA